MSAGPPTGKWKKENLLERLEELGIPKNQYDDWQLNILLGLVNGYTPLSGRITFPKEPTPLERRHIEFRYTI